ncbi:Cell death protease [Salix suchowensis]|nr:Cell death protease [Salix suchowensis]
MAHPCASIFMTFGTMTPNLPRPEVVKALHAEAHSEAWVECRGAIHSAFNRRENNSSITILPSVIERIPVLIFAGDQDLICNHVGLEAMIQAMTWNGAKGLGVSALTSFLSHASARISPQVVQTQSWSVAGTPAGTWVSSRNLTYAKIFNASHMAPFDVPHVTHDMILRFMGVNFSAIIDGSAKIPSSVGTIMKPIFIENNEASKTPTPVPGKTPEQDKAMWEAYYNAGSAALVLVLIFLALGTFLWCRIRRRRVQLPVSHQDEESIPLNSSIAMNGRQDGDEDSSASFKSRKGKERAVEPHEPPIFELGESDDEDMKSPSRKQS